MAKYVYRVVQDDTGWTAGIIRRVTARETMITKSQSGFASESEAQAWAEKELAGFAQNLSQRRVQRAAQHQKNLAEQAERDAEYASRQAAADEDQA